VLLSSSKNKAEKIENDICNHAAVLWDVAVLWEEGDKQSASNCQQIFMNDSFSLDTSTLLFHLTML
jgi:hypothetical protein